MKLDANRHYIPYSEQEVIDIARESDVRFISLWFTDVSGGVKSVIYPISELDNILQNGVHFDGSSIEGFSRVAESDMVLRPDLATFSLLPWTSGEHLTARIISTVYTSQGQPFIGDPRQVLQKILNESEAMGFDFRTGLELEFYLLPLDQNGKPLIDTIDEISGYFDLPDERMLNLEREMLTALRAMGIHVDSSHSETGTGQYEIGFQYNHALVSADHILTARIVLKTVAKKHGFHCTFMPRPLANQPGSGMHTHESLHDSRTGENIFVDIEDEYHLSELARQFLAGHLAHAKGMCAVLSPLVNSYKRLGTSFEAPVHITWAHINRSALIRIPSTAPGKETHTRLEMRSPDPSSNPYLAQAVMLASGLDGIKQRLDLPAPLEETLLVRGHDRLRKVDRLPSSLRQALDALEADDVILSALGAYISDRYIEAKRQEYRDYSQQITEWELKNYLTRY
ncbi:type I glutamate--ammonia ligase [Anaerolineales bacterium]